MAPDRALLNSKQQKHTRHSATHQMGDRSELKLYIRNEFTASGDFGVLSTFRGEKRRLYSK